MGAGEASALVARPALGAFGEDLARPVDDDFRQVRIGEEIADRLEAAQENTALRRWRGPTHLVARQKIVENGRVFAAHGFVTHWG